MSIRENREKVLKAMRSGEYQQITGNFRDSADSGCFCVLGLIHEVTRGEVSWGAAGNGGITEHSLKSIGLDPMGSTYEYFVWWNDRKALTFEEIADKLEPVFEAYPDSIVELNYSTTGECRGR